MNVGAAVIFYLLYVLIAMVLVLKNSTSYTDAAYTGALFGLGAYITYELTCMSMMRGWTYTMVITDSIWGMVLTSIVSVVVYAVYTRLV
jgi:uncharacterized membrane protein